MPWRPRGMFRMSLTHKQWRRFGASWETTLMCALVFVCVCTGSSYTAHVGCRLHLSGTEHVRWYPSAVRDGSVALRSIYEGDLSLRQVRRAGVCQITRRWNHPFNSSKGKSPARKTVSQWATLIFKYLKTEIFIFNFCYLVFTNVFYLITTFNHNCLTSISCVAKLCYPALLMIRDV